MEEGQENKATMASSTPEVGFPIAQPKEKKGINKWFFVLLGLILLGAGGIYFFTRGSKPEEEINPSPTVSGTEAPEVSTPSPSPTPVDKAKVEIEVQNGTGITGEAGYLQGVLKSLGYLKISAGNADKQDYTNASVTFSKTLSSTVVDEITKKLEEIYKKVETKTSTTLTVDVRIITGLRKGATPKPSATATPKSTASPTSTGSPTATPTSLPTPSPPG